MTSGAQLWSSIATLGRRNLQTRKPTDPTRSRDFDFAYENPGTEISREIARVCTAVQQTGKGTGLLNKSGFWQER